MRTTDTAAPQRHRNPWATGLAALSLLALPLLVAASAEAQRGGHGGGRGGYSGAHRGSGHHGGSFRGHHGGHRGHYGGYSGRYGGGRGYRGSYGYRNSYSYGHGYGRYSSHGYGGFHAYLGYRPGVFGGYAYYDPRVYGVPYVAYGGPAYSGDEAPDPGAYLGYDYSQDPAELYRAPEPETGLPAGETETGGPFDARLEPARVDFRVEPGDASVYLDGRFVGLAAELPETLLIEAGDHLVEVVRPGFASREVELAVAPGDEIEVDARLEPGGPPR